MISAIWCAVILVLGGASAWHAVTGHHAHLHVLRLVRPGTVVPETNHDAWWHRLPGTQRAQVDAALVFCAIMAGMAWALAPGVTVLVLITAVLLGGLVGALRGLARTGREKS